MDKATLERFYRSESEGDIFKAPFKLTLRDGRVAIAATTGGIAIIVYKPVDGVDELRAPSGYDHITTYLKNLEEKISRTELDWIPCPPPSAIPLKIGGRIILVSPLLVSLIRDLPGVEISLIKGDNLTVAFRFDGGCGDIMPLAHWEDFEHIPLRSGPHELK